MSKLTVHGYEVSSVEDFLQKVELTYLSVENMVQELL